MLIIDNKVINCPLNSHTVKLPKEVEKIENNLFTKNQTIKKLDLYDTEIKTIPMECFAGMSNLEEVILPYSLREISGSAFLFCTKLKKVVFPKTIEKIRSYAFHGCIRLERVDIKGAISSIGDYAFYDCESLKEVILDGPVTHIGRSAFSECPRLEKLFISNENFRLSVYHFLFTEDFDLEDVKINAIYELSNENKRLLLNYPKNRIVFTELLRLQTFFFPMMNEKYSMIHSNEKIELAEAIKENVYYTTQSDKFFNYALDNLLFTIDDFYRIGCLLAIGRRQRLYKTFLNYFEHHYDISELEKVAHHNGERDWDYIDLTSDSVYVTKYIGDKDEVSLPYFIGGKSVRAIKGFEREGEREQRFKAYSYTDSVFTDTDVKVVKITQDIRGFSRDCFKRCTWLEEVSIPKTLKYIGEEAFSDTFALKQLCIPSSVCVIGENAFKGTSAQVNLVG